MASCDYCHEDREGYVRFLPREGTGRASIHRDGFCHDTRLEISGPNRTRISIKIKFCPMCGRKLEG